EATSPLQGRLFHVEHSSWPSARFRWFHVEQLSAERVNLVGGGPYLCGGRLLLQASLRSQWPTSVYGGRFAPAACWISGTRESGPGIEKARIIPAGEHERGFVPLRGRL